MTFTYNEHFDCNLGIVSLRITLKLLCLHLSVSGSSVLLVAMKSVSVIENRLCLLLCENSTNYV